MARSRKAKKKARKAVPFVRRAVEDERVHGHVRTAATRMQQAYQRVSRKGGKAAEDKRLYDDLRGAVISVRQAALAIRKPPEPKHRGRKLVLVALAGGGAAVAMNERRRSQVAAMVPSSSNGDETPAPVAAGNGG